MLTVNVVASDGPIADSLVRHVQRALGNAYSSLPVQGIGDQEITVLLTGIDEISALHEVYFGDPSPTDVISFPSGDQDYLGDIAICAEVAAEQAREADNSEVREIVYLALHGLLHVLGWRDDDTDQRAEMLELQERLLRQYETEIGERL